MILAAILRRRRRSYFCETGGRNSYLIDKTATVRHLFHSGHSLQQRFGVQSRMVRSDSLKPVAPFLEQVRGNLADIKRLCATDSRVNGAA